MRLPAALALCTVLVACEEGVTDLKDGGCPPTAVTLSGTISGSIATGDCADRGDGPYDKYTMTVASPMTLSIALTGFEAKARIYDRSKAANLQTVIESDALQGNGKVNLFLAPGTYEVQVGASGSGRGQYSITLGQHTSGPCDEETDNLTMQGATIAGALTTNDCFGSGNQFRNDGYSIWMVSGRDYPMTVDAQSGIRIEVTRDGSNSVLSTTFNDFGKITAYTYRATSTGLHKVHLIGYPQNSTKTYTFRLP